MHQLKALTWKAYKVRVRSPYISTLDYLGPIIIILVHLFLKLALDTLSEPQIDSNAASKSLFRNFQDAPLDAQGQFKRHMCNKILYYSDTGETQFSKSLGARCGLELISVASREELLGRLQSSLEARISFKRPEANLNRSNSTDSCIELAGDNVAKGTQADTTAYQVGIVQSRQRRFDIHLTDSAGGTVIHVPYSQGSSYNEYRLPQSDLNVGLHLLEICIANTMATVSKASHRANNVLETANQAVNRQAEGQPNAPSAANTSKSSDESTPSSTTATSASTSEPATAKPFTKAPASSHSNQIDLENIKWRVKPYPVITGSYLPGSITMVILLIAFFCNSLATVHRVSEASELGHHQYIRVSGGTAGYYWLSVTIVNFIHMAVQSLILSVIMAIPVSKNLSDPICEMGIAYRWLLLLTYGVSVNANGMFVSSLIGRTSQALMVACLMGSCYSMHGMTIMLQWTPYGYTSFFPVNLLILMNPPSCFEALSLVIFGVCMQTNETFNLSHLPMRLVGGGFTSWSIGELWLLLAFQMFIWLLLTIVVDQMRYSTTDGPLACPASFFNEFLCCNSFGPRAGQPVEEIKTKSSQASNLADNNNESRLRSAVSHKDPNRICCSLRHVNVRGPRIMVAQTKGNPLKLTRAQLRMLQPNDSRALSKTNQYAVSRTQPHSPASAHRANYSASGSGQRQDEPTILIDEAIQQHIVWFRTRVNFENLNLNFKFNQVTFLLGQPDLKELLFNALLGTQSLDSGHVIIDGATYKPANMNLARHQIGHLSEKDIFFNELTIFENLQFFGALRDESYKNFDSESLYVLSLLHLSSRKDNFPNILTTRSARKLALGVAAVGYTKLLLLVEPTLNLRWRPRCQVLNLLKKYKSIRSIVVDTSDVDEATSFGDRIVLLRNGGVYFDGTPGQLARKSNCGYWLVMEPATGDGRTINSEAIKALEKLTDQIFKQDKLDLDATKRSVYHDPNNKFGNNQGAATGASSHINLSIATSNPRGSAHEEQSQHDPHKVIVILKIQAAPHSNHALCSFLEMLRKSNNNVSGFRLVELTYESVEDVIVLHISRAVYPELPPDLLLSLQHRTQIRQRTQEPLPVSVRKFSSRQRAPKLSRPIFGSSFFTIIWDRMSNRFELLMTSLAILLAILIVVATLTLLQASLSPTRTSDSPSSSSLLSSSFRAHPSLTSNSQREQNDTTDEQRYKKREEFGSQESGGQTDEHLSSWWLPSAFFADHLQQQLRTQLGAPAAGAATSMSALDHGAIDQLYKYRIGLHVVSEGSEAVSGVSSDGNSSHGNKQAGGGGDDPYRKFEHIFARWRGSKNLIGIVGRSYNESDANYLASLITSSKDLAASFVFYDQQSNEATVIFEPHLPHAMFAAIRAFINHVLQQSIQNSTRLAFAEGLPAAKHLSDSHLSVDNNYLNNKATLERRQKRLASPSSSMYHKDDHEQSVYSTSRRIFHQSWHQMIYGFTNRRFIYGLGFAFAESIAIGAMVLAPIRHRTETRAVRVRPMYWLAMTAFDMIAASILIASYVILFVIYEGTKMNLVVALVIVLFLYKLATFPVPYILSLAADSSLYAFLFVFLAFFTVCWEFAIHIRTFVEYTLFDNSYVYRISSWLVLAVPIGSLVEALTLIQQVNSINKLCPRVPAYIATTNTVNLEGIQRAAMIDTLLDKVRECLANGKQGISTDVLHQGDLGVLWSIYLILLFGAIAWISLLTCENFFGILARRFNSARTSNDPMKNVVRFTDKTSSLFQWDQERDRLISEYIRCMNELSHVKLMAKNCLVLRVWLKPLSDQDSLDRKISNILDPLYTLGLSKNDVQIELKTTLQLFIRIGDESKPCRLDRVRLIETYSKYVAAHSDAIAKFAVVDWTREVLYKILLHGHYNAKSTTLNL